MKCVNYTGRGGNLNLYLAEIRNNDSLTVADEIELFTKIANGDKMAETEVFNHTAKFAVAVAKMYTGDSMLLQDLIQEANMGILEAIPKFDINLGYRFISFAVFYMKLHISNFLEGMNIVRVTNKQKLAPKIKRIRHKYMTLHHRQPTDYELMIELEKMGEVVTDMRYLTSLTVTHIDEKVGSDDDSETMCEVGEFADRTASHNGFLNEIENEDIKYQVAEKMSKLDDREKMIIKLYYGFEDFPMTIDNIAEKMTKGGKKITNERVRQIILNAINKMKCN